MAKVLVRRTASQVSSPAELIQQLLIAIPGESQRLLFQRRARGLLGGTLAGSIGRTATSFTSAPASQISGSLGQFDQNILETARQHLAVYLGPIAKVLVKQNAAKAQTLPDLYHRLAEHIPSSADRAAFLKRMPTN
jgi:serine/threonine-protein kinase